MVNDTDDVMGGEGLHCKLRRIDHRRTKRPTWAGELVHEEERVGRSRMQFVVQRMTISG